MHFLASIGKIKPLFTQSHLPASAHPLPPCSRWCPRLGSARPARPGTRLAKALPAVPHASGGQLPGGRRPARRRGCFQGGESLKREKRLQTR